ncbi:MAG: HPP family protein [Zhongshania sp.]|uniref:HPP family protein n=1 Tax=Zhongshania sp. TaxID=1971902 RepID=UPI00261E287E|nr:HPP family protein [Zhongshania sp.]MDF1692361.1 HPP family protein [Zhongshania sp.]
MLRVVLKECGLFLGIEHNTTTHLEKWVSAFGGFCGIAMCYFIANVYFASDQLIFLTTSIGASAVLIFAAPHSALSQPWPVMGGHLISALIGVSCQQWLPIPFLTAPAAVGLAIIAMYYLRCLHPPGGATALFAVIGGPNIHAMGFAYVYEGVLLNCVALLSLGVLFNACFCWRRYPAHAFYGSANHQTKPKPQQALPDEIHLSQEDLNAALNTMNSFIDVSPEDLSTLFELATINAKGRMLVSTDTLRRQNK